MRAIAIAELEGPEALRMADVPDPPREHASSPGEGVLIEVRAIGVSFPDLLLSRGRYQYKPELPFVPGGEVAGVVLDSTDPAFAPGDRVIAMTHVGGMAERVIAPPARTCPLPPELDFAEGAALPMNYQTALFALRMRGRLRSGEWVLVHGAAGGLGSAGIQVARALGASTIAVVSSDRKEQVARAAGADEVVRSGGAWKDEARAIGGGGVDVVFDPVGGERFTDSLRSLRKGGRALVVGFTEGTIPEVKVNRLLLNNIDVVGAGLGAYLADEPELSRALAVELAAMVAAGRVRPLIGARLPLAEAAEALRLIERREATGKIVLELG